MEGISKDGPGHAAVTSSLGQPRCARAVWPGTGAVVRLSPAGAQADGGVLI